MRALRILLTGILIGSFAVFGWVYAQGNNSSGVLTGSDLAEIHHLHSQYNQGTDFENAELWLNAFTEDAIFRIGDYGEWIGREQMTEWRRQSFAPRSDNYTYRHWNSSWVITPSGDRWNLWDIDSPTQTIVHYDFDASSGSLSEPTIVVDLREQELFPDGMVMAPDGQSVIVALYNPGDAPHGEVRQYGLASGKVEAVWKTAASAQVTCPLLMPWEGRVSLILTTAAENMSPEKQQRQFHAGALFVGETSFDQVAEDVRLDVNFAQ